MILTELPFGLHGKIYRSVMPYGAYDREGALIKRYQQVGIDKVVVLIEAAEMSIQTDRDLPKIYQTLGLDVYNLPIEDFSVPESQKLRPALQDVIAEARAGKNIVIHCNAGLGRTGLFVACLAKSVLGLTGIGAIDWTRRFIPGAVESPEQAEFVRAYLP